MSQETLKILAFAGSTRRASLNGRLLRAGAACAEDLAAQVTLLDLATLDLPLYNGDDESEFGLPEGARRLKSLMQGHHALLVAVPEYNGGYTPLLKNAIDWASRREEGEAPLAAYRGLSAALIGASPGRGGAGRALMGVRLVLSGIGVLVIPNQFGLALASKAFDADGALQDSSHQALLQGVVAALCRVARAQQAVAE